MTKRKFNFSAKTLAVFLCLICLVCGAAESVKLNVVNGVPRMEADGVPLRPRIFWGNHGYGKLRFAPGEQTIVFYRTAYQTRECDVTFHLRFFTIPQTILLEDFEVFDETAGEFLIPPTTFANSTPEKPLPDGWGAFPLNETNTVATLELLRRPPEDGGDALKLTLATPSTKTPWPDFHLYTRPRKMQLFAGHRYRVTLRVNASVESGVVQETYRPDNRAYEMLMYDLPDDGSPNVLQRQIALAHDSGVDLISVQCEMPWTRPGEATDWSRIDHEIAEVLAANPEALVVPRLRLDPPTWWLNEHLDDRMEFREPTYRHQPFVSVSSRPWRELARNQLRDTILHLEKHFPGRIAGYHPGGQTSYEWFYHDSHGQNYFGYSPCEVAAFRKWLTRHYGSDTALQKAWADSAVTLATAEPPSPAERRAPPAFAMVMLPHQAQKVIDHNLFLQDEMADTILDFAHVIRETTHGDRLVFFFYGYIYEFANKDWSAATGHYALRRVLDSPDVDVLCSPFTYHDRAIAEAGLAMTAVESILSAGKLWLFEDDTRTHFARLRHYSDWTTCAPDEWSSAQILLRNNAHELIRNSASWWMDLGGFGWFDEPKLWQDAMLPLNAPDQDKLLAPRPYRPELASVIDTRSMLYAANDSAVSQHAFTDLRSTLPRTGAAFGQYMLEDLLGGEVPATVVVLSNAWVLDAEQRDRLRQVLGGKFVLWHTAVGIVDPENGASLEDSAHLTGFRIERLGESDAKPAKVQATPAGMAYGLDGWSVSAPEKLLFRIIPEVGDEILATWPDGSAAVVLRDHALYCATPELPRELLRLACRKGGAHLWTDDQCVLYTDGRYIVLHATQDGAVTIHLPGSADDLRTHDLRKGETFFHDLQN